MKLIPQTSNISIWRFEVSEIASLVLIFLWL
jgi:hypothetical protein